MTSRPEQETRSAFSNASAPAVLVYQMGKVGSQTVYHSLKNAGIPNPVLHLHFLSEDLPGHIDTHVKSGVSVPYHLQLGVAVRQHLIENADVACKIISLVRDPIAFTVSDLFQNPYFASGEIVDTNGKINAEEARKFFEDELRRPETFDYVDQWFDREVKRVFGIDVYQYPFDSKRGFTAYKKKNVDLLVIRLEDLSAVGPHVIAKFLGMTSPLRLINANVRDKMAESHEYRRVLHEIRIDAVLCREIYDRRYTRHFYNREMIEAFIARWAG
jgi:hypothetical protein